MANYNSGFVYNKMANDGGARYNSAPYIVTFKLSDVFGAGDGVTQMIAISVIYESVSMPESVLASALYMLNGELRFSQEQANGYALFRIADSLDISDAISAMIVALMISDNSGVLHDISSLAVALQASESAAANDITSISTLLRTIDSLGFSELSRLISAVISIRETAIASDKRPSTAIADFIIGDPTQVGEGDDLDAAFDWILPFGLMVDWKNSVFPRAPESESDEIQITGLDGETLEQTRYRNRQFNVVAWSEDDLSQEEKDALVRQITEILDSTKSQKKTLTFARTGVSFDVKYDGELNIEEAPNFIRATIPFNASAYGYNRLPKQVFGSGLIVNGGISSVAVINEIFGLCENPSFHIGESVVSWTGTVPSGSTLHIDHGKEVCYLEDDFGVRTNARQHMVGDFVKIPVGGAVLSADNDCTEQHLITTWYDKFLW